MSDFGASPDAGKRARAMLVASALQLKIIAEGVETVEQLDQLVRHGCHAMQGYLFSPAVPADAFAKLLEPGTFDELFRRCRSLAGLQPS